MEGSLKIWIARMAVACCMTFLLENSIKIWIARMVIVFCVIFVLMFTSEFGGIFTLESLTIYPSPWLGVMAIFALICLIISEICFRFIGETRQSNENALLEKPNLKFQ
jgi:hypothetical protein